MSFIHMTFNCVSLCLRLGSVALGPTGVDVCLSVCVSPGGLTSSTPALQGAGYSPTAALSYHPAGQESSNTATLDTSTGTHHLPAGNTYLPTHRKTDTAQGHTICPQGFLRNLWGPVQGYLGSL